MEQKKPYRRLIIHDLAPDAIAPDPQTDVAADNGQIHPCVGCYGCWIKTPGQCVLRDRWEHMGWRIAQCSELVLITQCLYGGPSPFVKNVLDRSIPYLHPDFARVNGQMHHVQRYPEQRRLRVRFYGDVTGEEQALARRWVNAIAVNMNLLTEDVAFSAEPPKGGVLL